jgi:extracellular solute-binding protein (family 5)
MGRMNRLDRRQFISTALKVALAPTLAQALAMGSVGRALAQTFAPDQTLRLAYTNPTTAFDTGREGGTPELHLLMFGGLTFYNWDTHDVEPVIATSWDYDPSTLTYIFHLRNDVRWTNGLPLTAADFEWTWKRNLSPELASPNVSFLGYIKNGVDYNAGKPDVSSVGVSAIDPTPAIIRPPRCRADQRRPGSFWPTPGIRTATGFQASSSATCRRKPRRRSSRRQLSRCGKTCSTSALSSYPCPLTGAREFAQSRMTCTTVVGDRITWTPTTGTMSSSKATSGRATIPTPRTSQ